LTQLTEHFSEDELGVVGETTRCMNAFHLCGSILEPIRAHFGVPIRVHCGHRDMGHNARVGGKPTSWHLFVGTHTAVDFDIVGIDLQTAFDWIRLHSRLPFDKVILESDRSGRPVCIHLQYDVATEASNRREAYTGSTGAAWDYKRVEVA